MTTAIDGKLKASLDSLELVQHACTNRVGDDALPNDEVKSAYDNLNQIIRTAESIREAPPLVVIATDEADKIDIDTDGLSMAPLLLSAKESEISLDGGVTGATADFQIKPSTTDDGSDQTQRLLSIPASTPTDTNEVCFSLGTFQQSNHTKHF